MKISHSTKCHVGYAMLIIGGAMMGFGFVLDRGPTVGIGVALSVLGGQALVCDVVTRAIETVHGPSRVMFDKGKEMGYQRGWHEGRRTARPVVIPMNRNGDDRASLSS